jgi:hypothetical protein
LTSRCFELGWIGRLHDSRAVSITKIGQSGFAETFGFTLPPV